jgi:uncharacterized membrane protein YjjB (DUF3815 family)
MNASELFWLLLQDAFWSGIAALGFATLFNVPRRALPGCLLSGAVGHAVRTLLLHWGAGIEISTLVGATTVSFLGMFFARYWRMPGMIFSVTGAIPMVPGTFAFSAMIGLVRVATDPAPDAVVLAEASRAAIKTALILGSLAFGIAAPGLLFRRHKPIV